MSFPQPKPEVPQLPQNLLRTIDCQQGAVRAVRFNGCIYITRFGCFSSSHFLSTHLFLPPSDGNYLSYDNSQLCSCSSDKTVILWDVATGQVTRKLRGHAGVRENNTTIFSCSIDGTVRCWDTRSRKFDPIQILDEAQDGVSSLKVSEHELLTGSVDGRVRRYDLRMGQLHVDFINSPITCVCFSADGQCTLTSSLDSTVRLLDKSTGEMLGEYTGHKMKGYKLDCCLSSKDTHVLSCSEDGHVYCWDLVEGSLMLKLPVGKAVVQSLSFHPSETRLLTAMEGRVQVWGAEPEETEEDVVVVQQEKA
uniref:WD repeat domain-containing protein 83 n=1 Tax=Oncorhynchus mykiss TaxID=8022 RepID=A0A8K9XNS5_ONCMY